MGSFATLWGNLKLNISDFSNKLNTASNDVKKFAADFNGKTVGAMKDVNKQTLAWGLNLKSVSRVVSGILISQAFYGIVQDIRSATDAVWDFTKQLEYAQIAYSNLFGNTSLATEFVNVLKDFAAKTPFSFTESEAAAKRLLAYGIEYKNVMYVMQGVLSAAAIQGDSAKIEPISRALGQIYTYGKLMTQEVRQLSEAGIPAYEILQEELGLTQEQLRNLGKEAIPASVAINALVDGIQKRFGNVTIAASKTIAGIVSNIKDNATMLFSGLSEPLTLFIKSALASLGDFLYTLRDIFELKGAGGVFEALFPVEAQEVLRQFVANFKALGLAITRLFVSISGLLKPVISSIINLFNAFAPIIASVANVLAEVVQIVTSNATAMKYLTAALTAAAAMWVVFKIRALAASVVTAVITGISKALAGLSTLMTFITAHPFWALLIGLSGILIGISGGFGAISDKISSFFKQLTKFNGVDADKVLLPSQKERANDLDKFNKKLEGTSDAMDDLADSTGKATKAAQGLLSFDEVFKLKQADEGTDSGIDLSGMDGLLEGLGGLGSAYVPEVPDFSEYTKLLTGGFIDKLKEAWKGLEERIPNITEASIGAGLGALLGRLFGGKVGGAIGLIAGAIVGYFWGKLAEYFGLTPEERVNAGIIGGVASGIGAVFGGILGGPLGAKIGLVVGGIVGIFWGALAEHLGVVPEQHIATMVSGALAGLTQFIRRLFIEFSEGLVVTFTNGAFSGFSKMVGFSIKGALVSALKQGIVGAIVGLGAGALSNALTGWIAKELELTEQDLANAGTGQLAGNIVGTITGFILGGPIGSLIGGALGQLAGSVLGEFWEYMSTTLKGTVIGGAAGLPIGALVGGLVGSIGGPLGAALGAAIGAALGAITGLIIDKWEEIKAFFANIGTTIADGFKGIVSSLSAPVNNVISLFSGMLTSLSNTFSNIGAYVTNKVAIISTTLYNATAGIRQVLSDAWNAISTVFTDIVNAVSTVLTDVASAVYTVSSTISYTVNNVLSFIHDLIAKVLSDIWSVISTTFTNILESIKGTLEKVYMAVKTKFDNIKAIVEAVLKAAFSVVSKYFSNIYTEIKAKVTNAFNTIKTVFDSIKSQITLTLKAVSTVVSSVFSVIYNTIKSAISGMYNTVKTGIANIYNAFTNWVSNLWDNVFGKFFNWINDGIEKLREFFGLESQASSISIPSSGSTSGTGLAGHAYGGIFTREHVARFAEGNKAEMVVPLENASAMQPFVDAISTGLIQSLAPVFANVGGGNQRLQPLYVGTLIADDRGLKELERKMEIIRLQENRR